MFRAMLFFACHLFARHEQMLSEDAAFFCPHETVHLIALGPWWWLGSGQSKVKGHAYSLCHACHGPFPQEPSLFLKSKKD